jgi:hypothetical protein
LRTEPSKDEQIGRIGVAQEHRRMATGKAAQPCGVTLVGKPRAADDLDCPEAASFF